MKKILYLLVYVQTVLLISVSGQNSAEPKISKKFTQEEKSTLKTLIKASNNENEIAAWLLTIYSRNLNLSKTQEIKIRQLLISCQSAINNASTELLDEDIISQDMMCKIESRYSTLIANELNAVQLEKWNNIQIEMDKAKIVYFNTLSQSIEAQSQLDAQKLIAKEFDKKNEEERFYQTNEADFLSQKTSIQKQYDDEIRKQESELQYIMSQRVDSVQRKSLAIQCSELLHKIDSLNTVLPTKIVEFEKKWHKEKADEWKRKNATTSETPSVAASDFLMYTKDAHLLVSKEDWLKYQNFVNKWLSNKGF